MIPIFEINKRYKIYPVIHKGEIMEGNAKAYILKSVSDFNTLGRYLLFKNIQTDKTFGLFEESFESNSYNFYRATEITQETDPEYFL